MRSQIQTGLLTQAIFARSARADSANCAANFATIADTVALVYAMAVHGELTH